MQLVTRASDSATCCLMPGSWAIALRPSHGLLHAVLSLRADQVCVQNPADPVLPQSHSFDEFILELKASVDRHMLPNRSIDYIFSPESVVPPGDPRLSSLHLYIFCSAAASAVMLEPRHGASLVASEPAHLAQTTCLPSLTWSACTALPCIPEAAA